MSFSFQFIGDRDKVIGELQQSQGYGDTHQHDAVRDACVIILRGAPDGSQVYVTCDGHHTYEAGADPRYKQAAINLTLRLKGA